MSNTPTSSPNHTSSSSSYSPVEVSTGNGPSLERPRSVSRHSDPPMGTNLFNGPSLAMGASTGNGPSLQRPRSRSRHSDPSLRTNLINRPSSPYRPHSLSHHSDPGDPRNRNNAPDYMVPGPSFHHAVSTPDLRASWRDNHQPLPAKDINYHYGNPARTRDFPSSPEREVEGRQMLVSRSLSDRSCVGSDAGFLSHSPAPLQRTFVYPPSYEGAPRYAKTFYLQSDDTLATYNGEYSLRYSGSVPDLSASYPPFSPHYYHPHSDRASPTPSQYSDYSSYSSYTSEPSPRSEYMSPRSHLSESGFSPNESGDETIENGSVLGLRRYERSTSRESNYLRSNSESPSGFGRAQSPSPSSSPRSVNYSSPRSKIPTYKSSTQQSASQGSGVTTKNDVNRTSNDGGRERSLTLNRTRSMSNLGDEKKLSAPKEVSEKRRDSLPMSVSGHREKYPLAKVPIPSFREFKQKKLERDSKTDTLAGKTGHKGGESSKSPKTSPKHESKSKADMSRSTLKDRLSSLYESSKDISAQNATKTLSESKKVNSSVNEKIERDVCIAKSADLTETKNDNSDAVKEMRNSRKVSRAREESPFSKNEVIHQLMIKYGLYEKGGQKKSGSPKIEKKEILSGNIDSEAKESSNENEHKRTISPRGSQKLTLEDERNWRNSTDHSNRSTPKSSPSSMRKSSLTTESKKSAAERFRELRRMNGIRKDTVESSVDVGEVESKRNLTAAGSIERTTAVKNSGGNDVDCQMADVIRTRTLAMKSKMTADETSASETKDLEANSDSSSSIKNSFTLRGTSRAILCASKFKRATNNTPKGSPLPNRKQLADIIGKSDVTTKVTSQEPTNDSANSPRDTIDVKRNESFDKPSPNTKRRRFRGDRSLRKGGIHTSMLSVASSMCSDTEMEDTVSIFSEMDSLDDERGTRGRRWESFHSNFSADSGSAHMFEFETDSNATEYDEVFDDQDSGGEASY